jgi:dipeptide/tripeptide permease
MRRASVCLAACAVVFALAGRFDAFGASVLLCLGIVLLTFGELLQSAGGWSLSYELAPRDRQGEYLAVFNLGVAAMYTAGPALVAIGIVDRGLPGWLALAGCFLVAGALVRPAVAAAAKQIQAVSR